MVVHVLAALTLMPVAGHPYDLASLTGTSGAWLRWGVPLFYDWKFGADLSILAVGSQSLAYVLEHLGMSGGAAVAAAWKLPLVLADLLVGVILVDLGKQLRCPRPGLIATLWLISPVPLWVSAGHGQIESLTVLAIVLSLDLLIRHRPLLAGIVVGLGIGVEYLPALIAVIVIFWLYASVIERREVCRFAAGCAGALALCFGPALATDLGRTSLLGGLAFTASVASHPGHEKAASIGSSLWAMFDLSPGPFWLFTALSTSVAFMIVLARKARSADGTGRKRLGILAAGGLLLCVTLFDPGVLPQFSVLVLAGLCLIGLCVDLSPVAIILGPSLQLAAGFFYVYGGSFQSFWYDMWVTTGTSGWSFPQSVAVQVWASRLGAVVVTLGLLFVPSRMLGTNVPARLRIVMAGSAIVAGALGTAFLATWSLQPAFWQGVGSRGPATLADFSLITQSQPGTLTMTPESAKITFSSSEVLAARESSVKPSLKLTVTARPFFARTTANTAALSHNAVQTVMIPGWAREKTQVHSLWISALVGRPAWRSHAQALGGVPGLKVGGQGQPISSSEATWVAPGWAVVTYNVTASMLSARGQLKLSLHENSSGNDVTAWNGSPHVRWVIVSLRSGTATATLDDMAWHGLVALPSPTPTLWIQRAEEASIEVAMEPRKSVSVTRANIGGQRAAIVGGSFAWPSSGVLDYMIHAPLLSILGVFDAVALIGGGWVLGRWAGGAFKPHVRVAPGKAAE
jgi:Glycosyltransferase family 87